jgi:exonuclease SbcC
VARDAAATALEKDRQLLAGALATAQVSEAAVREAAARLSAARAEVARLVGGQAVAVVEAQLTAADGRRIAAEAALLSDSTARAALAALAPRLEEQRARAALWGRLGELIGTGGARSFRTFAQGLALDALLGHANRHLGQLAPRYQLARVPGTDMDLQVVDQELGGAARGVNSLSGGETFLVSLGLALGLSGLATRAARVESLFVDEGFGTLDPETLDQAMAVLEGLQATGRTVGVISHVPELHERIGVLVQVDKLGAGRSRVRSVRLDG